MRIQKKAKELVSISKTREFTNVAVVELFCRTREVLSKEECDNTLKHTLKIALEMGLDVDRVRAWLEDAGGYCDCEVLMNATVYWNALPVGPSRTQHQG